MALDIEGAMVDFAAKLTSPTDQRCIGGWLRRDGKYFDFDGGPTVPMEVLDLIRTLDARGIQFQRGNGDSLRVFRDDGEKPEYLDGEMDQIRQWKVHILAIVELNQTSTPVDVVEPPKPERRRKPRAQS